MIKAGIQSVFPFPFTEASQENSLQIAGTRGLDLWLYSASIKSNPLQQLFQRHEGHTQSCAVCIMLWISEMFLRISYYLFFFLKSVSTEIKRTQNVTLTVTLEATANCELNVPSMLIS